MIKLHITGLLLAKIDYEKFLCKRIFLGSSAKNLLSSQTEFFITQFLYGYLTRESLVPQLECLSHNTKIEGSN